MSAPALKHVPGIDEAQLRREALVQLACRSAPNVDFCIYPRCRCVTEPRIVDALVAAGAIDLAWVPPK